MFFLFSFYFSILLPYTIALMTLDLLSKHFHSNGILELPMLDYPNCEQSKWKNVLFIDIFYPVENRVTYKKIYK